MHTTTHSDNNNYFRSPSVVVIVLNAFEMLLFRILYSYNYGYAISAAVYDHMFLIISMSCV